MRVLLAVAIALPLTVHAANLGIVTAEGSFSLNTNSVRGNATLTEGAVIETAQIPTRLAMASGARFRLDPNSRARVFLDRLVLERGSGELTGGPWTIETLNLRIAPTDPAARARFMLASGKTVQVAATSGKFQVRNASGVLVSNLVPGAALEFEPQVGGPAAPSSFVGCLLRKGGKYIIYDQTTRMEVELRGTGFEKEVGNRVQANGTARAAVAPANGQILDVTSVVRIEQGGCADVAQSIGAEPIKASAGTPASKPVSTGGPVPKSTGGMSAGTKVAIVGVVVGGAAAGGVLATRGGSNRSP